VNARQARSPAWSQRSPCSAPCTTTTAPRHDDGGWAKEPGQQVSECRGPRIAPRLPQVGARTLDLGRTRIVDRASFLDLPRIKRRAASLVEGSPRSISPVVFTSTASTSMRSFCSHVFSNSRRCISRPPRESPVG
jgi:hypothetical protein